MSTQEMPPIPYIGQIHPPYPTAVNKMRPTGVGSKIGHIIGMLIFLGIVGAITWGAGKFFSWNWLKYGGPAVCGLLFLSATQSMLKAQQAFCPFCNAEIGLNTGLAMDINDENRQFCCEHCQEWVVSNKGEIRAFREEDVTKQKEFDCLLPKEFLWPNECMVCGAPPARFLEANTRKFNAASLVIGRISVSSGSVKNIPHCAVHEDGVAIKIKDDKVHAVFNTYSARRRFLHVNRSRVGTS